MKTYKTVLQISIPTFNRRYEFENCLACLHAAYVGLNENGRKSLTVRIFNNNELNSTTSDFVASIYAKYSTVFEDVGIIENGVDIGSDRNIAKAYKLSESKYTVVLGDDDYVERNYFVKLLDAIDKCSAGSDAGIIFYNSFGIDKRSYIRPTNFERNSYLASAEAIECLNVKLSFISSFAVSNILEESEIDKYVGSCLVQLGVVFEVLRKRKNVYYVKDYLVAATRASSFDLNDNGMRMDWTRSLFFQVFITNYFKILRENADINYAAARHNRNYFERFILYELCRRWGGISDEALKNLSPYFKDVNSFKIIQWLRSDKVRGIAAKVIFSTKRVLSTEFVKIVFYYVSKLKSFTWGR